MSVDYNHTAYIIGSRAGIKNLQSCIADRGDDQQLVPLEPIKAAQISAHDRLSFKKDSAGRLARARTCLNRPYPFPITCAEIAKAGSAHSHSPAPQDTHPPSDTTRVSIVRLIGTTLTARGVPDAPVEHLTDYDIALCQEAIHFANAYEAPSMNRHDLSDGRSILEIHSGWIPHNPPITQTIISILYEAHKEFDLIDAFMDDYTYDPTYYAGKKQQGVKHIPPKGCKQLLNADGCMETPSYAVRRGLAAAGFDDAVLTAIFAKTDSQHRQHHLRQIAAARPLLRAARAAAQTPEEYIHSTHPSTSCPYDDEIPF